MLIRTALLSGVLLAALTPTGAFASDTRVPDTYYEMHLSSTAATVQAGGTTTTVITFEAGRRLTGRPVDLSVSGLPAGATASFTPAQPRIEGRSTLTITLSSSSPEGAST